MRRSAAVLGLALCLTAAPAFAQATGSSSSLGKPTSTQKPAPPKPATQKPPAKPKVPRKPIGVQAFGLFDLEKVAASQAFDTVTGSSWLFGYGGGVDVLNIWSELFIRGALTFASTSGQRSNVVDGVPLETGFPVDIGQRTIEIGAGWRFPPKNKNSKATYYVGGGLIFLHHSETSDFAEPDENVNENVAGFYAMGGVDFALSPTWFLGIEGQWRAIGTPEILGGAAAQFGETNLGGFIARVRIGFKIK
jgi:hypothetical protein